MSDLIRRKALIEALRKDRESVYSHVFCHTDCQYEEELSLDLEQFIENQPTVEAVSVVHGKWKRVGSGSLYDVYECTNCHCPPKWDCLGDNHWKIAFTNFCPNCGADMRKKD